MSRYDDLDSPDYREHNQGGYDDSPEEKEIERLDNKVWQLTRTRAAQRTALLALSERIRREGMQGVANEIEEIIK